MMVNETLPLLNKYRDAWAAFIRVRRRPGEPGGDAEQGELCGCPAAFRDADLAGDWAGGLHRGVRNSQVEPRNAKSGKTLKSAIRNLNEDLEKKVAERTEELARTVETLQGRSERTEGAGSGSPAAGGDRGICRRCHHRRTLDGIITDWNPGAERMFGFSAKRNHREPISLITPQDLSTNLTEVPAIEAAERRERGAPRNRAQEERWKTDPRRHFGFPASKDQTGTVIGCFRHHAGHHRAEIHGRCASPLGGGFPLFCAERAVRDSAERLRKGGSCKLIRPGAKCSGTLPNRRCWS